MVTHSVLYNATDFVKIFGFRPTPVVRNAAGTPTYSQAQIDMVNRILTERANAFLRACWTQTDLLKKPLPMFATPTQAAEWMERHNEELRTIRGLIADLKGDFWIAHRTAKEQGFKVNDTVGAYGDVKLQSFLVDHPEAQDE